MGKYRGKAKTTKSEPVKPAHKGKTLENEFSDDSDAVFSDEDKDQQDDEEQEAEEMLSPAEDDDDDDDEPDHGEDLRWGNKRSDYFKRNEESSEEEDDIDNEEEATRLLKKRQSKLKNEDLELGGADEEEEEDEEESKVIVRKTRKGGEAADDKALAYQAPEVLALMSEFSTKASEVRDALLPILDRLRSEEASTKEGIAYLETKTHLLLSYAINVAFYLLYRAENGSTKAELHPVVTQLVRLRTLLEKLRPLDLKLKNEIDELVRRAVIGDSVDENGDGDDEVALPKSRRGGFRPELADLEDDNGNEGPVDDGQEAIEYEDEKDRKRRERDEKKRLVRAGKSQLLKELREEQSDAPQEVVDDLRAASKQSQYEMDKRRYEEENFVRVRENKATRAKAAKQEKRAAVHGGDMNTLLNEIEDNEYDKFKDLLDDDTLRATFQRDAEGEDDDDTSPAKTRGSNLAKHLNEMSQARKATKTQFRGGDDDVLPTKKQRQIEPKKQEVEEQDDHDDDANVEVDEKQEHPFYREQSQKRKRAADERNESYQFPKRYAPEPVRIVDERPASREMIRNRGLTPHRKKDMKNPRKKLRIKYEEKVKARKGQVRDVRKGEGDYYQGESTGIRSSVVRSRQAGKF